MPLIVSVGEYVIKNFDYETENVRQLDRETIQKHPVKSRKQHQSGCTYCDKAQSCFTVYLSGTPISNQLRLIINSKADIFAVPLNALNL